MPFHRFPQRLNQQTAPASCKSLTFPRHANSGFSILEVLISLLIFAVGFLGLASLQHVALSSTYDASLQNTAVDLASSLLTRVRVEGVSLDISAWQKQVSERLPGASGQLLKQGDDYLIRVQWQESSQSKTPSQTYQIGFRRYD